MRRPPAASPVGGGAAKGFVVGGAGEAGGAGGVPKEEAGGVPKEEAGGAGGVPKEEAGAAGCPKGFAPIDLAFPTALPATTFFTAPTAFPAAFVTVPMVFPAAFLILLKKEGAGG